MSSLSYVMTRIFSIVFVSYVLSTLACEAARNSQIINSYPLAISFDGHSTRQVSYQPMGAVSKRMQPAIKRPTDQAYRLSGQSVSTFDFPRSLNFPMIGSRQAERTQPLQTGESGSFYNKRTLAGDNTTSNLEPNKFDYQENSNANVTSMSDTQKLLLLRQKMIDMQGRVSVSIEDTNWKIAASCLSNKFGPQFIRNRDVKCASSQIVLAISRLQRSGCKYCESYFYCEGYSNAIKRCKNNYDVQGTLNVMRECQGLTSGDQDNLDATRAPADGIDCQKIYLCGRNCNYNPSDGTCPRNNCYQSRRSNDPPSYRSYLQSRKGRIASIAYPAGSPMRDKIAEKRNK